MRVSLCILNFLVFRDGECVGKWSYPDDTPPETRLLSELCLLMLEWIYEKIDYFYKRNLVVAARLILIDPYYKATLGASIVEALN